MSENMIGDDKFSGDELEEKECPLCLEAFDADEYDFYPCKCEYQICRFCWHRIKEDESGLCPACRQAYPENPVNFKPPSNAELKRFKQEKKQRKVQDKSKLMEPGSHLSAYRVLQKNLVYIIGLSHKYTEPEQVKKCEHFSRFGKIMKVVVGQPLVPPAAYTTQTTFTAYITYAKVEQALSCIGVNNTILDGRMLKASLGTTKYCSNFLRNILCNKPDCMYLHEVADPDFSFTKDDMQLGKHTDCERRLIEKVLGSSSSGDMGNPSDDFLNNDSGSRNVSPINMNKDSLYSDMRLGHFITQSIVKKSINEDRNDGHSNNDMKHLVNDVLSSDIQNIKLISPNSMPKGTVSWDVTDAYNTLYDYFQSSTEQQQSADGRMINDLKISNKSPSIPNTPKINKRPDLDSKKSINSIYWDPAVLEADDEPLKENFDWKKALGITGTSIVQCLTPPSKVDKEKHSVNTGYDILSDPHKWYLEPHKQIFIIPTQPVPEQYKKISASTPTANFDNGRYPMSMMYQQNGVPPNQGHTNPNYGIGQSNAGFVNNIGTIGQQRASITPVISAVNPGGINNTPTTTQAPSNAGLTTNSSNTGGFNFQNFVSQLHNPHAQISGTTTPVPSMHPNVNIPGTHEHTAAQQPNMYPPTVVYHEMLRNMQLHRNYQMLQQMSSMGFPGGQKDFHNMPSNYQNTYQPPSSAVTDYNNINNEFVGGNIPRL
uniref:RING-type domain-containing protein n=1 Tax=Parastrongyloides trichosuri TaxID=131310 RepID=A0A0N5A794_PARTI